MLVMWLFSETIDIRNATLIECKIAGEQQLDGNRCGYLHSVDEQ